MRNEKKRRNGKNNVEELFRIVSALFLLNLILSSIFGMDVMAKISLLILAILGSIPGSIILSRCIGEIFGWKN